MGAEIGPAADGAALALKVECRTSKLASRGPKHRVRITPDWELETPHDLAAERVAMAFGGYCSCVVLADRLLPALRDAAQLLARRRPVPIAPAPERGWVVGGAPAEGCACTRHFFATAQVAAEHARSSSHLARVAGLGRSGERRLAALVAAVSEAHHDFPMPAADPALVRRVRDVGGPAALWRAGLDLEDVRATAELVPGDEPLPVEFFLAVAYRNLDREWLRATVARRPDPDVATFLAWTAEALDPHDDGRCGEWLALGLPSRDVEALLHAGTTTETAHELARELGWRPRAAASYLAAWARAGCEPTIDHVRLLDRVGLGGYYTPSPPAVRLLELACCELPRPPSRTDLAVILALAGTRSAALDLIERGVADPFALVSQLA